MASSSSTNQLPEHPTPGRLWAEQLAAGLALALAMLVFMAIYHQNALSVGAEVLGPNYLRAYGWASVVGILLQVVVHEAGTLLMARHLGLPRQIRFLAFGANATAILQKQPRHAWQDAVLGLAGPVTGTVVSLLLAGLFYATYQPDTPQIVPPFFLGMACVGYFYNLFTLIPILDLEGGWISPAIAPQGWLAGLILCVVQLTLPNIFNLLLLCVLCFGLPRLFQLITARVRRTDLACSPRQRWIVNLGYFALVLALAWLSTVTFQMLPDIIRDTMGD